MNQNGVFGNFNELAGNPTLQESRLTALPSSMSDSAISRQTGSEVHCWFPGRWDFEISLYSAERPTFNLRTRIENGSEVVDLPRSQTSHDSFLGMHGE